MLLCVAESPFLYAEYFVASDHHGEYFVASDHHAEYFVASDHQCTVM
jgi:hypothetical protein